MADRPNTLQLPTSIAHQVDWRAAAKEISAPPGRAIIEMIPFGDRWGSLFLPDKVAANLRPDVGVVLAVGSEISIGSDGELLGVVGPEPELMAGDVVVVRGYDGTWREKFAVGDYKAQSTVRCYGLWSAEGTWGEVKLYPWHESIVARLTEEMNMIMLRDNMLVKRDPLIEREGLIELSNDSQYRNNTATVLEVGPRCSYKAGDRIIYYPGAMLELDMINGDPDLGILQESTGVEMCLLVAA